MFLQSWAASLLNWMAYVCFSLVFIDSIQPYSICARVINSLCFVMFFPPQRSSVTRYGLDDATHLVLDHKINDAHQQPTSLDIQVVYYVHIYHLSMRVCFCIVCIYVWNQVYFGFPSFTVLLPFLSFCCFIVYFLMFLDPYWGFPSSIASAICMKTLEARATLKFALDITESWTLEFTQNNSKQQKNWIH